MFDRWRPVGPTATVIRIDEADVPKTLARVKEALEQVA
jgi:hypothetical protein